MPTSDKSSSVLADIRFGVAIRPTTDNASSGLQEDTITFDSVQCVLAELH